MTDTLIAKITITDGNWQKFFLRKNGTIHEELSTGGYARHVTPDGMIGVLRLKKWSGKFYLNVDALKRATGIAYI